MLAYRVVIEENGLSDIQNAIDFLMFSKNT